VTDRIPQRVAGIAAILFVIALVVSTFALTPSGMPKPNDSAARWASYISAHRGTLQVGNYVGGIATIAGLFYIAALSNFFARLEGALRGPSTLILVGGVTTAAVATAGGLFSAVLDYRTGLGSDLSVVRVLVDAQNLSFVFILFPLAVWIGGAGISTLRNGGLPRWVGILALADAVVSVAGGAAEATHGVFRTHGPFGGIGFIAFLAFLLWSLIAGVLLLRLGFSAQREAAPAT
jgi:hypothetical protein